MIKVWILVIITHWSQSGGVIQIENLASGEECSRVIRTFKQLDTTKSLKTTYCVEVWKKELK
jgi:hypothetical protein